MGMEQIDIGRIRQYIQQKMDEKGITRNELTKNSKVARGTVDHFFDGSTVSPAFDRVCYMILSVGGSVDEALGLEREKKYVMVPSNREDKAETVDAYERLIRAKNAHMQELEQQNRRLREQNRRLAGWHRFFLIENVFLLLVTIADLMIPTFGYFRGKMESLMHPSSRLWG